MSSSHCLQFSVQGQVYKSDVFHCVGLMPCAESNPTHTTAEMGIENTQQHTSLTLGVKCSSEEMNFPYINTITLQSNVLLMA